VEQIDPRLITFDFGDTLVTSVPSYLERTARGLGELGHPFTVDQVRTAYFKADVSAAETLLPRAPFKNEEFEQMFSAYFFKHLGLEDKAAALGPPLLKILVELRPDRVMVDGAKELLERLADRGYPMGIISNNDGFTREKCEAVKIDGYFLFILDSTKERMVKPDPRFFLSAAAKAGVPTSTIIHVGDLWGCDVMGARAAGVGAVWLANQLISPDPMPGAYKINKLIELLDLLKP